MNGNAKATVAQRTAPSYCCCVRFASIVAPDRLDPNQHSRLSDDGDHIVRTSLLVLFAAPLLLGAGVALGQTNPCTQNCSVAFEWGNGGTPPDVDRIYGAPSSLESAFIKSLRDAGWNVSTGAPTGGMSILVRLYVQNRVRCEAMSGTNTDMSCHTVGRGTVTFTSTDTTAKAPGRTEFLSRCSDPKSYPTFAQFGQYVGETLAYQIEHQSQGARPRLKCQG